MGQSYVQLVTRFYDLMEKPGWGVMSVFGSETTPPFSYTIGLWQNYAHPEIIVLGLPQQAAHAILNIVARRVKDGEAFGYDCAYDQIAANYPARFRPAPSDNGYYFGMAKRVYGKPFEARQLVWTDKHGHFPWETEYSLSPILQTMQSS